MQFSTTLTALAAVAFSSLSLVSAQNPFSFNTTIGPLSAGTPFDITWAPSTGTSDTVTLVLREGESTALATVMTIGSKIQNTGTFTWTPPSSLPQGTQYAFEIIDDGNTAIVNYSEQFTVDSNVPASTPAVSSTSSAAASSSTDSTTATTSAMTTGVTTAVIKGNSTMMSTSSVKTGASTKATNGASSTTSTAVGMVETEKSGAGRNGVVGAGMVGLLGAMVLAL